MGLIDIFRRKAEEPKPKFGDCNLSAIEFVTKQLLDLLIDKRDEEEAKKYKPKAGDLIRLRLNFMDYICIEGDDNAPVACLDARDGVWRLESKEPQIFEKIWKADDFDTVVYSRSLTYHILHNPELSVRPATDSAPHLARQGIGAVIGGLVDRLKTPAY